MYFSEFWKIKKELVEACALLIAIGAVFLSISAPAHNNEALEALFYVQMIWLIIITISIFIILLNFWKFFVSFEKRMEQGLKTKLSLSIFTTAIFITAMHLIYYTWKFMLAVYREQYLNYFYQINIHIGAGLFITSVTLHNQKIMPFYQNNLKKRYYLTSILVSGVFSSLQSFLSCLAIGAFDFIKFFSNFLLYIAILFTIFSVINVYYSSKIFKAKYK